MFLDLVWSDPEEIAGWATSPRGAGYLFGASVTQEVSQDSMYVYLVVIIFDIIRMYSIAL